MPTIKKRGLSVKQQAEQEITTITHYVSAFMETYKKYLVITTAVAAAALVIGAGYLIMRSLQEQKAAPLIAAAYEQYHSSGGAATDFQKALTLFRDVQNKYPGTMSGAIAQYYVGNCLTNLNQTDEAIKEYQKFIKAYSGEKFLLGLVYQRLGYVYAGLGKQADAIKAFEEAEALTGPGISTFELARLYEAVGNVPNAQNKYKLIMDKLSGTTWARESMGKVQKIALPGAAKEVK